MSLGKTPLDTCDSARRFASMLSGLFASNEPTSEHHTDYLFFLVLFSSLNIFLTGSVPPLACSSGEEDVLLEFLRFFCSPFEICVSPSSEQHFTESYLVFEAFPDTLLPANSYGRNGGKATRCWTVRRLCPSSSEVYIQQPSQ